MTVLECGCIEHCGSLYRPELLTIYIDQVPRASYLSRTRRPAAYNAARPMSTLLTAALCLSVPQRLRDAGSSADAAAAVAWWTTKARQEIAVISHDEVVGFAESGCIVASTKPAAAAVRALASLKI